MFQLSNLAPGTDSKHFKISYRMNMNMKYDGCTCGTEFPDVSLPLSIIPVVNEETFNIPKPEDWEGKELCDKIRLKLD